MTELARRRPTTHRPKLGFLGVGWIGRHRMEAVVRSGAAEICAIADAQEHAVNAATAATPGALALRDLEEILDAGVDGVVIATPSALHAEQTLAALERGVAVFCQKPLGRSAEEVRRVVAAAKEQNLLLGVDLSYRFTGAMRALRPLLQSGELGGIYAVDLVFHNAYGPDKPWFYDRAQAGGGCVMDLGIHLVDLALWSLGFPEVTDVQSQLRARGRPISGRDEVEDYASVQLETSAGASIRIACSWKLPAGCDAVIEASFYGTKGGASLRNVGGSFYDFTAERYAGTRRERLASPPDEWGGRAAVDWARRLAEGARYDARNEELIQVSEVLDRIYGR